MRPWYWIPPFPAKPAVKGFGALREVNALALPESIRFTGALTGAILTGDRDTKIESSGALTCLKGITTACNEQNAAKLRPDFKLKCPATSTKCPGLGHREFV